VHKGANRLHGPCLCFSQARIAPLHEELRKEKLKDQMPCVHEILSHQSFLSRSYSTMVHRNVKQQFPGSWGCCQVDGSAG
jgi:hypothetical protein